MKESKDDIFGAVQILKIYCSKRRNIQREKLFVSTVDSNVSIFTCYRFIIYIDEVSETVDKLRSYLRSQFV